MPWRPYDAPEHSYQAVTPKLRELWAKVANAARERGEDVATAIKEANAAVAKARRGKWWL